MASPVLLGLDPGTRRMGYCYGTGEDLPTAGAWRFDQCGDQLGKMLHVIGGELKGLIAREGVDELAYEGPIKKPYDALMALRKTFSLGAHIEFVAYQCGLPYSEVNIKGVKKELAGFAQADKTDMIYAAEKLGVGLPLTKAEGREDAADALGVWLMLLRARNKRLSGEFDRRLWSARGALL